MRYKDGTQINAGDIVTFDVFDETETLRFLRPFLVNWMKNSRIVIKEFNSTLGYSYLVIRWQFGNNFNCSNVAKLDDETAAVLVKIGSLGDDLNVD